MLKLLYAIIGVFYLLVINLAFHKALRITPVVGLMRFFFARRFVSAIPQTNARPYSHGLGITNHDHLATRRDFPIIG